MSLVILMFLIMVFVIVDVYLRTAAEQKAKAALEVCPPHKWRHQETKNEAGEIIAWNIVCDNCHIYPHQ